MDARIALKPLDWSLAQPLKKFPAQRQSLSPSHVVVLVPARNEEALLPRCLASILRACGWLPGAITYDIVVAVDASTDGTCEIAERMLRGHGVVVRTDAGCVGRARALAGETALLRYAGALESCWIANTDADCCVPERWLVDQIELAAAGFGAVAGIVDVDGYAEHAAHVAECFRRTYLIHADGTHPHVHGANLGVRADAYQKAGGWGALATAEDHDLWERLLEAGTARASVARLVVMTSGRRVGRASGGFAEALAAHNVPVSHDVLTVAAHSLPGLRDLPTALAAPGLTVAIAPFEAGLEPLESIR